MDNPYEFYFPIRNNSNLDRLKFLFKELYDNPHSSNLGHQQWLFEQFIGNFPTEFDERLSNLTRINLMLSRVIISSNKLPITGEINLVFRLVITSTEFEFDAVVIGRFNTVSKYIYKYSMFHFKIEESKIPTLEFQDEILKRIKDEQSV